MGQKGESGEPGLHGLPGAKGELGDSGMPGPIVRLLDLMIHLQMFTDFEDSLKIHLQ